MGALWKGREVCGQTVTYGGAEDPYGATCDLLPGHFGKHEGDDALAGGRVRWTGGLLIAGDRTPARIELVPAEQTDLRETPCLRGTPGCSVQHTGDEPCETW